MSDVNSSLPIRTEANGDAVIRLVDGTVTSQFLTVNANGSLNIEQATAASLNATVVATDLDIRDLTAATDSVEAKQATPANLKSEVSQPTASLLNATVVQATAASLHTTAHLNDGAGNAITSQANSGQRALDVGINVAGVQIDPRSIRALTATDVVTSNQGTKGSLANAWPVLPTDGTNSQSFTAAGEAKVDITQPLPAGTNLIGTVHARLEDDAGNALTSSTAGSTRPLDVALRDGSGNLYTSLNPLPITFTPNTTGEVNSYSTSAALAGGATSNHDYTVTALKTLLLQQIEASGSGKMKIEVQIESAAGSGTFATKFVQFNSTATPNMHIQLPNPISVAAGVRVRVIRTNKEGSSQDVYSTISGQES